MVAAALETGAAAAAAAPAASASEAPPPAEEAVEPPSGSAKLDLLDPGKPPRRKLRYVFHARESLSTHVRNELGVEMEVAGRRISQSLPSHEFDTAVETLSVEPNGVAHCSGRLTHFRLLPSSGTPPEMVAAFERVFGKLDGITFTRVVTTRGDVLEQHFETRSLTDTELKNSLDRVSSGLSQLGVAWPVPPVGVGAKWRVSMPLSMQEMTFTQTTTVSVLAIGSSSVDIATQSVLSASQSGVERSKVVIQNATGTAAGHQTVRLDPMGANGQVQSEMDMDMVAGNTPMHMHATTNTSFSSTP